MNLILDGSRVDSFERKSFGITITHVDAHSPNAFTYTYNL